MQLLGILPGANRGCHCLTAPALNLAVVALMGLKIFISVADASGDQHAAEFITALRKIRPDAHIRGIGGPRMTESGAMLFHETVGGAAMGWRGALRAIEVIRILRRVRKQFEIERPDLHVCIDSSAMNLPFAKMAKSMGIPVLYYIAPQLWASRESRMKQVRKYVDRIACILPFEELYYRSHGVNATFVGHPLFDELPTDRTLPPGPRFPRATADHRNRAGLAAG